MMPKGQPVGIIDIYPYRINMFWMSPDRQKIVKDEAMLSGSNNQTDLLSRLVLSNADGTEPVVLTDFFSVTGTTSAGSLTQMAFSSIIMDITDLL